MKFFKSSGTVVIGIDENGLELGHINKKKENYFELKNYKYQNLDKFEILDSLVLNPTLVQFYINSFFIENKIYKPNIYLYLSRSTKIKEFIITSQSASSSRQELFIDEDGAFIWGFDYLGYADGSYFYYVIGMAQELLFQYKLLFSGLPGLFVKMTTQNLALLNAKKIIGGDILDLQNLNIENLSNNLILPKVENFILSDEIKTSKSFLPICFGMLV